MPREQLQALPRSHPSGIKKFLPVQALSTKLPWTYPQFPPLEWTLANGLVEILVSVEFTTLDENYRRPVDPVQAHSTKLPWDLPQFPPWEWTLANKGSSGMA